MHSREVMEKQITDALKMKDKDCPRLVGLRLLTADKKDCIKEV